MSYVHKDNIIDKGILGSKGLIQQIHNTCGVEKCCEFINQTQQLTTKWITQHSFSVSFGFYSFRNSRVERWAINSNKKFWLFFKNKIY